MRRFALLVLGMGALVAVLATAIATAAEGEMATEVRFGPKGLSLRQDWTGPAHPPAERELQIELDKNLKVQTKGLPACHPGPSIQSGASFEGACAGAQVGSGEEIVQVAFPESMPINVPAKLRIFNGGEREGAITLFAYGKFSAPISGALITKVVITRIHNGRLGRLADAQFPEVAGGSGSVDSLRLTLSHGVVAARCTDGKLQAHFKVDFEDGTSAETMVTRACTSEG